MGRGKYSPVAGGNGPYTFNCYGKECAPWSVDYDEKTMFGNYDSEGYDSYGYSAFYANGTYAGIGAGVDRNGYTEYDYSCMNDVEFFSHC